MLPRMAQAEDLFERALASLQRGDTAVWELDGLTWKMAGGLERARPIRSQCAK